MLMSTALNGLLLFLVIYLFWRINQYEKVLVLHEKQLKSLISELNELREQVQAAPPQAYSTIDEEIPPDNANESD